MQRQHHERDHTDVSPITPDWLTGVLQQAFWSGQVTASDSAAEATFTATVIPLVRRYHQQLQAQGMDSYDWAQCWEDYRLSLVFHTSWPTFWHGWSLNDIWWRELECFMAAFEDLRCQEFI